MKISKAWILNIFNLNYLFSLFSMINIANKYSQFYILFVIKNNLYIKLVGYFFNSIEIVLINIKISKQIFIINKIKIIYKNTL